MESSNLVADFKNVSHEYYRYEISTESFISRIKLILSRKKTIIKALQDVSFEIYKGDKIAILGPNGAGKSTLIKIMLGIIKPKSGRVRLFGLDPYKYRRKVAYNYGVVFGNRNQLWWHIPVLDTLKLLKRAYGISDSVFEHNLETFGSLLCPKKLLYTPPQKMSLGQRRRCEFLASLIHRPSLLVLDEPFLGLDIFVREKIRHILKLYSANGGTIILSTHELSEIPEDYKVLLLVKGKIIYYGTISDLLGKVKPVRYILIISRYKDLINLNDSNIINYEIRQSNGLYIHEVRVMQRDLRNILSQIDYSRVLDVKIETPSLNYVIKELVKDNS